MNLEQIYIANGIDFSLKKRGNSTWIKMDKNWRRINANQNTLKGTHIIHLTHKEINKRIALGIIKENKGEYVKLQAIHYDYFSKKKLINKDIVAIDINNCYWTSLFINDFISETHYLRYIANKEYKISRNASIGSCCARTNYKKYVAGELVIEESMENPLYFIYNKIISDIFNIALLFYLKYDCFMFLTDCFFCDKKYAQNIKEDLKKMGFETTIKIISNLSLLEENNYNKIQWNCENENKHYLFGNIQNIDNSLEI